MRRRIVDCYTLCVNKDVYIMRSAASVFPSVCVPICNARTVESTDLESSFLVGRFIFMPIVHTADACPVGVRGVN